MTISQLFRERQIIIRSEHGVRYLRLSPLRQKLFAGVSAFSLLALAGWSLSTSTVLSDIHASGAAFVQSAFDRMAGRTAEQDVAEAMEEESVPEGTVLIQTETSTTERIAELERRLENAEAERRRLAAERDKLESERLRLASTASAADKKAAAMVAQQEAIQQLIARARAALDRTHRNMSQLGLEPNKMLALAPRQAAAGGPFIEFKRAGRGSPAHDNLVALGTSLDRLADLQRAARAIPVGAPLGAYGVASSYGLRRDPFNGRMAMHNGIDLAAPQGAEVRARAPGKIVFAGRNGPYGNMVEIDHGFGLRTRYGHLSAIYVKEGQSVQARDKLAAVGSTGRSTAPHLHYEISFNGKTIDPRKFVESKNHVF
jgi:murein DD-endopeptidase MepM/ murein hydrolase activator NlpD